MNANTQTIPTDTALQLVADQRRRKALQYLIETSEQAVPIEELAGAIVEEKPATAGPRAEPPEEITIELHHLHLPKMAEAGIIDVDTRSGTVRYHSRDDVEELVQFVSDHLE